MRKVYGEESRCSCAWLLGKRTPVCTMHYNAKVDRPYQTPHGPYNLATSVARGSKYLAWVASSAFNDPDHRPVVDRPCPHNVIYQAQCHCPSEDDRSPVHVRHCYRVEAWYRGVKQQVQAINYRHHIDRQAHPAKRPGRRRQRSTKHATPAQRHQ